MRPCTLGAFEETLPAALSDRTSPRNPFASPRAAPTNTAHTKPPAPATSAPEAALLAAAASEPSTRAHAAAGAHLRSDGGSAARVDALVAASDCDSAGRNSTNRHAAATPHADATVSTHAHHIAALRDSNASGALQRLPRPPEWRRVLPTIAVPAASLVLIYAVTLAIFPGFLSEDVTSVALGSWYPVLLFLVFAAADCASRWLPAPPRFALAGSLVRCATCSFIARVCDDKCTGSRLPHRLPAPQPRLACGGSCAWPGVVSGSHAPRAPACCGRVRDAMRCCLKDCVICVCLLGLPRPQGHARVAPSDRQTFTPPAVNDRNPSCISVLSKAVPHYSSFRAPFNV